MIIVHIDGQEHRIEGRVAAMIRWLVEHRQVIAAGHRTIRFLCRGHSVTPSIEEHHESVE